MLLDLLHTEGGRVCILLRSTRGLWILSLSGPEGPQALSSCSPGLRLDVVLPSLVLSQPGLKDAINSRLMGSSLASPTFSR